MRPNVTKLLVSAATAAALVGVSAGEASAGAILSPASVYNNTLGDLEPRWEVGNLIDQSGLSASFTSGVTDFDAYLSGSPTHSDSSTTVDVAYASPLGVLSGAIDFDLGATYTIQRMALWNDTDIQALGDFSLLISNDPTFSTSTSLGAFAGSVGTSPLPALVFDLADGSGRYVRLNIAGPVEPWGSLVNFGEVAFEATASTAPEPASLLLLGTGLIGVGVRRWRNASGDASRL